MVFTTFLIPFGSGMVVTNVVWYWHEFDCLIPEWSRDIGLDMGSCERETSICSFSLRGAPPRADPTAHRSPNAAMGSASGTPPSSSRSHTAGPVRESRNHWRDGGAVSDGERRAQPAAGSPRASSSRSTLAVRCNSCGMRMDNACRQATSCWHT